MVQQMPTLGDEISREEIDERHPESDMVPRGDANRPR